MSQISDIIGAGGKGRPGPLRTFMPAHLILAMITLENTSHISRQHLADALGLGSGAVRTLLKNLSDEQLVESNTSGCYLSSTGKKAVERLNRKLSKLVQLGPSNLTIGSNQVAVAVRRSAEKLTNGISQRDSAIVIGASGATTFAIEDGMFVMPGGSSDCERDFPGPAWTILKNELIPKNGDAVILCGATSDRSAKLGALAAAMTLL